MKRFATACGLALTLSGCGHHPPEEREPKEAPFHAPVEMLLHYDADHDGTVTREEMEAGLKADFAAADKNHDGCLDSDETAAVNHARWEEGLSTTSTIVDWNHDGCVDFNEFANTYDSVLNANIVVVTRTNGQLEKRGAWEFERPTSPRGAHPR